MPRRKHGYGSKTAFVLGMPEASPQEIVAAAAKVGLKFSDKYVHTIRYNAKRTGAKASRGGRATVPRAQRRNGMTKSDFILGMPDTPAKDVVAASKKAGIKGLTERYVYVTRSAAKAKARRVGGGRGGAAEAELRRAIAELGLGRARQVLADVESAFR